MALPRAHSLDNIFVHQNNQILHDIQAGNATLLQQMSDLSRDTTFQIRNLHEQLHKERLDRQKHISYVQARFRAEDKGQCPMTGPIGQTSPTFCAAGEDIQGDFKVLKDSLNTVRLYAKLNFNDSRSGIKREDNVTYNNLAKSAGF
jgi:hypothetical protein